MESKSEKESAELRQAQRNREEMDRGGRAELLKAELGSVCGELRERVLKTFELSEVHDDEGHRSCRLYLEVLADIQQCMVARIETGKAAQHELKLLN